MEFTGERFVPNINNDNLAIEHMQRYLSIRKIVADKTVLDAACGEGYGSSILADTAGKVIGVDISADAVKNAGNRYSEKANLSFVTGDISSMQSIEDNSIDVVVSFETIEHVDETVQLHFLQEIKRVLKHDGILVMSTPNRYVYSELFHYRNEFHKKEFSIEEFEQFLHLFFGNIRLFMQSFEIAGLITENGEAEVMDSFHLHKHYVREKSKYIIALAGDTDLSEINLNSVMTGKNGDYIDHQLRIIELQNAQKERNEHIQDQNRQLEEKGHYIRAIQKEWEQSAKNYEQQMRTLKKEQHKIVSEYELQVEKLQQEKDSRSRHIAELNRQLEEKGKNIYSLQHELTTRGREYENQISMLQDEETERNRHIEKLNRQLKEKGEYIYKLQADLTLKAEVYEGQITRLQDEGKERGLHIEQLDRQLKEKGEYIISLQNQMTFLEGKMDGVRKTLADLTDEYTVHMQNLQDRIEAEGKAAVRKEEEYKQHILKKEAELLEIKGKLHTCQKELTGRDILLETANQKIRDYEHKADTMHAENEQLKDQLVALSTHFEDQYRLLSQNIKNKEGHIEQLLEKEREFERIRHQRSYRIGEKIHLLSEKIIPGGSTRRFVLGTGVKCLLHPVKMIKFLSPHRISKFFYLLRMGGMEAVQYRYRVLEAEETAFQENPKLLKEKYDLGEINGKTEPELNNFDPLVFEEFNAPLVSIIIPVYNQFQYTYNCLKAILKHTTGIAYEIIIADDVSSDLTVHLDKLVSHITIIRNEENLGFLRNCNYAAKKAKGDYLLFLNNDTQVQENWLPPLLRVMESDEKVGLVGSKLIYANGQLQEAGGIVWKDASAWNYGNQKDPDDPEYAYVKEADYVSGASILLRSDLWKALEGFDEYFAPAYYEDTDLAFRVRARGYSVKYQPESRVVHYEGISNGTDLTDGMKQYQVINRQKFYARWKTVLEEENFPNGENVFAAKDRSRSKKHILVIDHYVPHYDKDAGGRCTFMWLKMFVKSGFQVTFIGDNYFKHEPYTSILNQMGIEVLYGNFYYLNHEQWLKENLHYFDFIYLQRPHISIKYIDLVTQYGRGKIFYFAHDLHFLRLQREYELTGKSALKSQMEEVKKQEFYLFDHADVVHVVGSYEQAYLQKLLPEKTIRDIPIYLYEEMKQDVEKDFSKRQDLIFVGGFGHTPNIDAVLWFAETVFPLILEKNPDIKWHIVGGKAPEEVTGLANEHIILHGFVSDEKLAELYNSCRLAVVPLRYGAGVKGKVVEAAYYQIPLVTTTIGAEGISFKENAFAVEDDPQKMAELIIELYRDYGKLEAMSNNGIDLIKNHYTMQAAEKIFRKDAEY